LQEAENWQGDRATIEPETFCYLKEIVSKRSRRIRYSQKPNSRQQLRDRDLLLKINGSKNNINMLSHSQDKPLILRS